jgi:lysophospholipase L1-like esterase
MTMLPWLVLTSLCGAAPTAPLENAMPARVAGPWAIEAGPGAVTVDGRVIRIETAVTFEIAPPDAVAVSDERVEHLPVYNEKGPPWRKGHPLARLQTEECSATGLLDADSLGVKSAPGDSTLFQRDKDYRLEPFWANLGVLEGGTISADQTVYVDYRYRADRIDSIAVDAAGQVTLVRGDSGVATVTPPKLAEGSIALVNLWVPGTCAALTEDQVLNIEFTPPPAPLAGTSQAERFLPKTLAKLTAGQPVTIVAWGDSVTNFGAGDDDVRWYQNAFAAQLRERFPQSRITMLSAAWPGGNSKGYMEAPAGGTYDFQRDVLDPKPDLVTIEFVNDAYFDEAGVKAHYGLILEKLRGIGAEVALITPHLVRLDWLKSDALKFDDDPRPYVHGLRLFARENKVALADASKEWCRLWRQGIPYSTLLVNSINHPGPSGHAIFTRALMGLFP